MNKLGKIYLLIVILEILVVFLIKHVNVLFLQFINLQVWSVLEDDTETAQSCQLFVETFSPSPKVVLLLGKKLPLFIFQYGFETDYYPLD